MEQPLRKSSRVLSHTSSNSYPGETSGGNEIVKPQKVIFSYLSKEISPANGERGLGHEDHAVKIKKAPYRAFRIRASNWAGQLLYSDEEPPKKAKQIRPSIAKKARASNSRGKEIIELSDDDVQRGSDREDQPVNNNRTRTSVAEKARSSNSTGKQISTDNIESGSGDKDVAAQNNKTPYIACKIRASNCRDTHTVGNKNSVQKGKRGLNREDHSVKINQTSPPAAKRARASNQKGKEISSNHEIQPVKNNQTRPCVAKKACASSSKGHDNIYVGRVITVRWGDHDKKFGIDGSLDAIKQAITYAFGLKINRPFWLEDEDGVVRSIGRGMPLKNYTLHLGQD